MVRDSGTSMALGFVLYTLAFFIATVAMGFLASSPVIMAVGAAGALTTLLALLMQSHTLVEGVIVCYLASMVVYAIYGRIPHSAVSFTGIVLYYVAKKTVEAEEFWKAY